MGMKIWSLTFEKAEKLRQELEEKRRLVEDLEVTSPPEIWENDLDALEKALDGRDDTMDAAEKEELKAQNKSKKRQAKKKGAAPKKKGRKQDEWNSSDDESSDEDLLVPDLETESAASKKRPPTGRRPRANVTKKAEPKRVAARPTPPIPPVNSFTRAR